MGEKAPVDHCVRNCIT